MNVRLQNLENQFPADKNKKHPKIISKDHGVLNKTKILYIVKNDTKHGTTLRKRKKKKRVAFF